MSLNAVYLIGLVAARPSMNEAVHTCTVLLVTSAASRDDRQRHRVLAHGGLADGAAVLSVGELVFVAGRLGRDERHRIVTVARELWAVTERPLRVRSLGAAEGHHASPRDHERAGHWRRIHAESARERLCWVRPTTVRGRSRGCDPAVSRGDGPVAKPVVVRAFRTA